MATGMHATLSPLPISESTARSMEIAFKALPNLRQQEGRSGDILDESYAKVTDYNGLTIRKAGTEKSKAASLGSSWVLECQKNHGSISIHITMKILLSVSGVFYSLQAKV